MIRNILVALLLVVSLAVNAQRTNSSPYSFFGIGEEFNPITVEQSSMGGIGVAFNHYKYLNFTNPAAYSNLRYTTYAFGMLNNSLTIKNGDEKQNSNSTSLSYFALAFPIGEKAGFSLGLQPVSSVGYSLVNTAEDLSKATILTGDGGVNEVAGVVHKGEWVAPKWMVNQMKPLFDNLEGARWRGFAGGWNTSTVNKTQNNTINVWWTFDAKEFLDYAKWKL